MTPMTVAVAALLFSTIAGAQEAKQPSRPSFEYEVARTHEIKPHRRTIPLAGISSGTNQLRLTLVVSPAGDVVDSKAEGNEDILRFWPKLQGEVSQWRFTPFEKDGKAITAEVEEYLDLAPPERLPKIHVVAPVLRKDSKVTITLRRSGCFGSCPSYTVAVSSDGIAFDGGGFVVAAGAHKATTDADEVRKLAQRFVSADFYSMNESYRAGVTDCPTYILSISVDGKTKSVLDYMGTWEGMPAVITELEEEVDALARTQRWIAGSEGLVDALKAEKYNFQTFEAQVILKEAASRGNAATVRELLEAGVPLKPFPAPKPKEEYMGVPFSGVSWLNAGSRNPETLLILIAAGASSDDQGDKDKALAGAASAGNVAGARALIAYGANPNADLSKLTVTRSGGGMTTQGAGSGSVLIEAAASGNPEMVREILRYHPKLELRDHQGKTAIFAAGEYRSSDVEGARVECVRLLVQAGADVNARDKNGNTALHGTFLTDVEEELLKLGAEVNARNEEGETPIFTNVDNDAIGLYIKHGADLTIRNNKGRTVMEAAAEQGPAREEALRKAIQESKLR